MCRKRIWEERCKRYNGVNLYHETIGDRFSFFVPDFLNFPQYAYICNYCYNYYYLNIRNRFYLSPWEVWVLNRFLNRRLTGISLFSSSPWLVPGAFPELLPSPWSSVRSPCSHVGFFRILTFLTRTWWSGEADWQTLSFPVLSGVSLRLFLSGHLSAPLGSWFPSSPSGLADLLILSTRGLPNLIVEFIW